MFQTLSIILLALFHFRICPSFFTQKNQIKYNMDLLKTFCSFQVDSEIDDIPHLSMFSNFHHCIIQLTYLQALKLTFFPC